MSRAVEKEGLVILLDVGVSMSTRIKSSTYLQTCVDIIQMIVQRKMFQSSKDELALVLFGTRETANVLWDGSSDHYSHVSVARPLSIVDWQLLDFIQNDIGVSNLQGDILDGILVASNHFHEDSNKSKVFKDKRIIILSDFSSSTEDDGDLSKLCKGLAKHGIRVDTISPFSDSDDSDTPRTSRDANDSDNQGMASNGPNENHEQKTMTPEQRRVQQILQQVSDSTEGAMYSFDEVLTLLSSYQSKSVKSSGTKYMMRIGDSLRMPIVSVIKCKENKPDLFKFKKVYARDETVELKMDRVRFTKDEEQRDLDDKTEVVDAFRYGSTYVPIDDPESLKLKVEKCFDVLGFTKSENVKRHSFLSDGVQQIMPEPSASEEIQEAFTNMVHSMFNEDVYGIVRRVFSCRSSPELACLIPHITNDTICLLYMALPFDDDLRKFTLENFQLQKKYKANPKQLALVDELIDSMDLTKKTEGSDVDSDEDDELYDPHTTFNPYIQRMFQSFAMRATNPSDDLPDFDKHITSTHLTNIGKKVLNKTTLNILKRCAEVFPTKLNAKKAKESNESNIFEKPTSETPDPTEPESTSSVGGEVNPSLVDILNESKSTSSRVKQIGTRTPVEDFKSLVNDLDTQTDVNDFEELSLQLQNSIREIFNECLRQMSDETDSNIAKVFQEKAAACIRVLREYCLKLKQADMFNMYLKSFKRYLVNESTNKKLTDRIESFWNVYFRDENLTLISKDDCDQSEISCDEAIEFIAKFTELSGVDQQAVNESKEVEDVEDLLDLM